jgi:hypothetical protein
MTENRYICTLSYDGRTCPESIFAVTVACILSKKNPVLSHTWGGIGAASGRTEMLNNVKHFGKGRGFIIDYDIRFNGANFNKLIETMRIADARHVNVVSPYFISQKDMANPWEPKLGFPSYLHKNMQPYTDDEMKVLKDWQKIEYAGLGFYYGDIDPDYEFHEISRTKPGEDINFFKDNNIQLVHVDLGVSHVKYVDYVYKLGQ